MQDIPAPLGGLGPPLVGQQIEPVIFEVRRSDTRRRHRIHFTAPEPAEQKHRAFRALDRALRGENAEPADDTDPALIPSYAVWSLVHGYATLALEGAIDSGNPDPLSSDLLPAMLALLSVRDLP
ncbi:MULTISPECIES: TetR-like C-terminal domain-containing protein [Streptomyces]|uniref:TetR-like C-terminal domain-containing protein n=1 Tax=Streptomyces TaxID=1883 RepID=UPI0006AD59ED|nr:MULTISPECIES: TetR-like C-terminal domain-containing protein [Streptomyces]MCR8940976.1 WHG domain-containing protein [Streptomyces sp. OUCMDZ-4982]MDI7789149.1 TetR-like C-terminal domain-containing protein [Streptomyces cavourensis]